MKCECCSAFYLCAEVENYLVLKWLNKEHPKKKNKEPQCRTGLVKVVGGGGNWEAISQLLKTKQCFKFYFELSLL